VRVTAVIDATAGVPERQARALGAFRARGRQIGTTGALVHASVAV